MNKKQLTLPLLLLTTLLIISCKQSYQDNIIELPLTYQKGYKPFISGMGALGFRPHAEDSPWAKTTPSYIGIPEDWTETVTTTYQLDMTQFVYQNYRNGNITEEFYNGLRNSWDWFPNETELSELPLKCFISILRGKTPEGEVQYIVDSNNNLDFGDDKAFTLTPRTVDRKQRDSLVQYAIPVKYERIYKNNIQEEETYLMMEIMENMPQYVFANIAQYATTSFGNHKLGVISANFTDMAFHRPSVTVIPPDLPNEEYLEQDAGQLKDEYLELDGNLYKILGVDRNRDVLRMEKMTQQRSELESTQPGFKAFTITGEEFSSKDSLSLSEFKGKYIYLDFWATWCGPCIGEFPGLREIYANTDRSRFQILGIVGDSDAESLTKSIEVNQISWPQILSTNDNPITKTYRINAYPTTFLIDTNGVIIARNLRGDELKDKLKELDILH